MPDTKVRPTRSVICIWCKRNARQCSAEPCERRSGNDPGNVIRRFPGRWR